MALIKCIECKKTIADDSEKCPNCGTTTNYGKIIKEKEKKRIIILAFLLLVFCIGIFVFFCEKKDNDKVVGVWVNEKIEYDLFPVSFKPYETKQYKKTTTDSFTFNKDGTCVNDFNILSEYTGNSDGYSSPCKYKVSGSEITITWLDDDYWTDENDNDVKTLTMPLVYGYTYIVFDDTRYERK